MATIKELESELAKAKKLVVQKAGEINRLRCLLLEVEPALAQANSQVDELRSAVDDLTSQKVSVEENLKQALDMRDASEKAFREEFKKVEDLSRDLGYENARRISAENKLFDLEQRLHNVATSEYEPSEVQKIMVGLRINRHGDIA